MKLVEFSVTNYRSITTAHKIKLQSFTVLLGKNNEGKSNLLNALNIAMRAVMLHSHNREQPPFSRDVIGYKWSRDFPVQLQQRHSGLESIFRLEFRLEETELTEFHTELGIRGNENIPISVKIGRDNRPRVDVPKKGSASYKNKSKEITEFISKRISFNYIQAIRTDHMAIDALQNVISEEIWSLNKVEKYVEAIKTVQEIQQGVLDKISERLYDPLRVFLPNLKGISIKNNNLGLSPYRYFSSNHFDVIIDDGVATSISSKGDGIKSLVTLAILKDKEEFDGASIIAIEEPESHLHSGAIHSLVDVLYNMSSNSQVIITTHNPLFVQQNSISSNIIVDNGTARTAKNIAEIRNILGVLPSDNLRNARYILVVEGESDKISLAKILSYLNPAIKNALAANNLIIKALGGAGNLSHDLNDLRTSMCKYVVLMDNDDAGIRAADLAKANGLLDDSQLKFTICNGSPISEFEDCLLPAVYAETIMADYSVDINVPEFRGNSKWTERMKAVFLSQGTRWTEALEKRVKDSVANSIPAEIQDINNILIPQKSGFIYGLITAIEAMISSDSN